MGVILSHCENHSVALQICLTFLQTYNRSHKLSVGTAQDSVRDFSPNSV